MSDICYAFLLWRCYAEVVSDIFYEVGCRCRGTVVSEICDEGGCEGDMQDRCL